MANRSVSVLMTLSDLNAINQLFQADLLNNACTV